MARLNISVPDDLYELASRWRGSTNLSEICARALREELEAAEANRTAVRLLSSFRSASSLELEVANAYGIERAFVSEASSEPTMIHESLGRFAASVLDAQLHDGQTVFVGGGRQMWSVVKNLSPRALRVTLAAMGLRSHDRELLHAHPNTLVTLLWLLYTPRARAHLTGSESLSLDEINSLQADDVRYLVVSSCAEFDTDSPISKMLGSKTVEHFDRHKVIGDFAYQFLTADGGVIPYLPPPDSTVLSENQLRSLCARSDSQVFLLAAGERKLRTIRTVLQAGLCSSLITDEPTAHALV